MFEENLKMIFKYRVVLNLFMNIGKLKKLRNVRSSK